MDVYSSDSTMLVLEHDTFTGERRIVIQTGIAQAWISYHRTFGDPYDRHDWRLWIKRDPLEPALARKSPTRLEIESRLRAWLLQRFRRRLSDLRFAELCQIAELTQKSPTPWRRAGTS